MDGGTLSLGTIECYLYVYNSMGDTYLAEIFLKLVFVESPLYMQGDVYTTEKN